MNELLNNVTETATKSGLAIKEFTHYKQLNEFSVLFTSGVEEYRLIVPERCAEFLPEILSYLTFKQPLINGTETSESSIS